MVILVHLWYGKGWKHAFYPIKILPYFAYYATPLLKRPIMHPMVVVVVATLLFGKVEQSQVVEKTVIICQLLSGGNCVLWQRCTIVA